MPGPQTFIAKWILSLTLLLGVNYNAAAESGYKVLKLDDGWSRSDKTPPAQTCMEVNPYLVYPVRTGKESLVASWLANQPMIQMNETDLSEISPALVQGSGNVSESLLQAEISRARTFRLGALRRNGESWNTQNERELRELEAMLEKVRAKGTSAMLVRSFLVKSVKSRSLVLRCGDVLIVSDLVDDPVTHPIVLRTGLIVFMESPVKSILPRVGVLVK